MRPRSDGALERAIVKWLDGGFSVGSLFEYPERPISAITGLFVLAGLNFSVIRFMGLSRVSTCYTMAALQVLGAFLALIGYPRWPHRHRQVGHVFIARGRDFNVGDALNGQH